MTVGPVVSFPSAEAHPARAARVAFGASHNAGGQQNSPAAAPLIAPG